VPAITSIRILLVQLFQNLISNGIRYRGEKPPVIRIRGGGSEGGWTFSVRDNGWASIRVFRLHFRRVPAAARNSAFRHRHRTRDLPGGRRTPGRDRIWVEIGGGIRLDILFLPSLEAR